MKKLLLSLLCLLAVGLPTFATEASYTITFLTSGTDNTAAMTTGTSPSNYIANGQDYISSIASTNNVYPKSINGLKFSSSKATGKIVWNLSSEAQVNATKIEIEACKFSSDAASLSVQGQSTGTLGETLQTYTINLSGEKLETLTIEATKRAYVKSITVYYDANTNAVATPLITPGTQDFSESFSATITCATDGASIYYTLDGSTPSATSTLYSGAISIPAATTTLKAIAVKDGMDASNVAEAVYTFIDPAQYQCANIAEWLTKAAADTDNDYTITGTVTIAYNNKSGNNQYTYIQDASGALLVFGVNNTLTAGQTLTGLSGKYKIFNGLPEMINANLTSLTPGTGTAPAPVTMTVGSISDNDLNKYVKLTNVVVDPATKTATQGTESIALYSRYDGVTFPTEEDYYDIEGFVGKYNTIQFYPTVFTPIIPNVSWSAETAQVSYRTGGSYTLPTLSNPDNTAVTYQSTDTSVATIDASGVVTVLKPGTTTIKALYGFNNKREASYTLTVDKIFFTVTFTGMDADGSFTATMGQENNYPTYTVEPASEKEAYWNGVVYRSSDTDVATIAPDGTVTLNGVGETDIRITNTGNDYAIGYNYPAYKLIVVAGDVELQNPVIEAYMTTDFAEIENGGSIAKEDAPVYISVENPNADTTMSVMVMTAPTMEDFYDNPVEIESVENFTGTTWNATKYPKESGFYVVSAMVFNADFSKDSYAEFYFTIEGDEVKTYVNPIVDFTDGDGNSVIGTTAEAPVNFIIENQNPKGLNTSIYYFVTTDAEDPEYTKSATDVEVALEEAGTYRYSAYIATYDGEKLTGTSETVSGTFTVTPAIPKDALFAATDKDGAAVESGATVAEDKAPVTVVITNPNANTTMEISTANMSNGVSSDYSITESTYTLTFDQSGEHAIGVYISKGQESSYAEFYFTIEGEIEYPLTKPYVEFLDEEDNEIESPSTQLPLNMVISNQNYNEGVEMVYTIDGNETVTTEHEVIIPITAPGTISYSVYCRLGKKSKSDVVSGKYVVTADAVKLNAPAITFSTPEGEIEPVTVTITNPNLNGIGTIMYSIGTSAWFEGEGATVTFTLPNDGVYTVRAYVRNNSNEDLSSDITTAQYTLDGIETISFGAEGVKVAGGHIIAPEGTEVYTINGMRVNTLDRVAPGIYIVRLANGATTKVIVK